VAAAIINALESLDLHFPKLDDRHLKEIEEGRRRLEKRKR
jgi:hypothetical protein